jgi:hypothetical protein
MDFTNRPAHSQAAYNNHNAGSASTNAAPEKHGKDREGRGLRDNKWLRAGAIIFLVCIVILVVAAIGLLAIPDNSQESKYIDKNKYQAVFINGAQTSSGYPGGSVYFGHIVKFTNKYLVLNDVYFLTSSNGSNSGSNSQPQLTPLGCLQIHSPYDQMVIQVGQVSFWENLQSSGQVASKIKQYQSQYPNGPNCSQATQSTGSPTGTTNNTNNTSNNSSSNSNSSSNPSSSNKKQ